MSEYRTAKQDWGLVRVQTGAIGLPCPAQVEGDHDRIRALEAENAQFRSALKICAEDAYQPCCLARAALAGKEKSGG